MSNSQYTRPPKSHTRAQLSDTLLVTILICHMLIMCFSPLPVNWLRHQLQGKQSHTRKSSGGSSVTYLIASPRHERRVRNNKNMLQTMDWAVRWLKLGGMGTIDLATWLHTDLNEGGPWTLPQTDLKTGRWRGGRRSQLQNYMWLTIHGHICDWQCMAIYVTDSTWPYMWPTMHGHTCDWQYMAKVKKASGIRIMLKEHWTT